MGCGHISSWILSVHVWRRVTQPSVVLAMLAQKLVDRSHLVGTVFDLVHACAELRAPLKTRRVPDDVLARGAHAERFTVEPVMILEVRRQQRTQLVHARRR